MKEKVNKEEVVEEPVVDSSQEEQVEEQVQMGYEDAITAISTDLIIVATRLAGSHNKKQSEVLEAVADKVTEITG